MDRKHWVKHLKGSSPGTMAPMIIGNLLGYPPRSRQKALDIVELANVVEAIQWITKDSLADLLSECRTAITEQWNERHPLMAGLVAKLDDVLSPIGDEEG